MWKMSSSRRCSMHIIVLYILRSFAKTSLFTLFNIALPTFILLWNLILEKFVITSNSLECSRKIWNCIMLSLYFKDTFLRQRKVNIIGQLDAYWRKRNYRKQRAQAGVEEKGKGQNHLLNMYFLGIGLDLSSPKPN